MFLQHLGLIFGEWKVSLAYSVRLNKNRSASVMQTAETEYTCRWLDGSSLIFADNVKGLKLDPPNRIVNNAGCTHGNHWRPISLGKNATDVTFTEGRDYMS